MSKVPWHQKIGTIHTTAERYGVSTGGIPTRLHDTPVFVNRRLRTRMGLACRWGLATWIEIHRAVFANPKQMRDTLAHEIAHILLPDHGHDQLWISTSKALGGNGKATFSRSEGEAIGMRMTYRVVGHCEKCGDDVKRVRALNKRKRFTHSGCGGDIVSGAANRTFMKRIFSHFLQKFLIGNYRDTAISGVKLSGLVNNSRKAANAG